MLLTIVGCTPYEQFIIVPIQKQLYKNKNIELIIHTQVIKEIFIHIRYTIHSMFSKKSRVRMLYLSCIDIRAAWPPRMASSVHVISSHSQYRKTKLGMRLCAEEDKSEENH